MQVDTNFNYDAFGTSCRYLNSLLVEYFANIECFFKFYW